MNFTANSLKARATPEEQVKQTDQFHKICNNLLYSKILCKGCQVMDSIRDTLLQKAFRLKKDNFKTLTLFR